MARNAPPPARRSKITIPERCHPLAKIVFAEMQRQNVTYDELEWRSGVLRSTFKAWRTHNKPGLESIEAALGALGWAVLPVPRLEQLPPQIQAGVNALATEWKDSNVVLGELLASVCRPALFRQRDDQVVEINLPRRRRKPTEPNPYQTTLKLFEEAAA